MLQELLNEHQEEGKSRQSPAQAAKTLA